MSHTCPSVRRRGRLLAPVLFVLVLVGCGQGDSGAAGSASAVDELHRAAEATLASSSFVIHVATSDAAEGRTIVYQAPDRVHDSDNSGERELITIGQTAYFRFRGPAPESAPGGTTTIPPNTFQRIEAPAGSGQPVDGSLAELRALAEASQVERDGPRFHWREGSDRNAVSGDAHIAGGRIESFTFRPEAPDWTHPPVTYRITDYDAAPAVEPPPADQVVDMPATPPCGPDGSPPSGQMMCSGGGDRRGPTTTTTVALPAPTVKGVSPLELRRVLATQTGPCTGGADTAAANGEIRLDGPDGCYRLGAILATIRRAEARPEAGPSGVTVSLDLSPSDGTAVRSALSGQYQRQVAMVMFGRVLSAPIVQDPELSVDTIAVSAIDPQTAANIIRSLSS